ncbi:hypothetical protein [Anaerosporobacter faecicola]|uniref:hypothetical protein n=1 Tax=Anaerosporobacter faecicola TaxID=2718714 RepID=UPI001439A8A7|nr:hypothetical protein [Anaerosporobacter faecicola]
MTDINALFITKIVTKGACFYYNNTETGISVVYDKNGNYFRIEDTTRPRGRNYLDINGNDMNNEVVSEQMEELVLLDEQYTLLEQLKLYDQINDQCDVIIDDNEEEVLSLEKIPLALEVVNKMLDETTNKDLIKIKGLLELALKYKTIVGFDF